MTYVVRGWKEFQYRLVSDWRVFTSPYTLGRFFRRRLRHGDQSLCSTPCLPTTLFPLEASAASRRPLRLEDPRVRGHLGSPDGAANRRHVRHVMEWDGALPWQPTRRDRCDLNHLYGIY